VLVPLGGKLGERLSLQALLSTNPQRVRVETMGLEPTTPCLQSQIGRDRHLQRCDAAQVDAASALSVVVRSGPVRTAVNGTPVARPPRMTPESACALLRPDPTVRPVFGDHRLVGKSPEGSRQPDGGLELRKMGLRTVWVEP
jgi:hypothetical protein